MRRRRRLWRVETRIDHPRATDNHVDDTLHIGECTTDDRRSFVLIETGPVDGARFVTETDVNHEARLIVAHVQQCRSDQRVEQRAFVDFGRLQCVCNATD